MEMNDTVYKLAGERQGKTAAAIWPWKCKEALFQYNEAYHTFENQDGQAWDADSGDGTVYQYNYSYNNGGGCVMFCEPESVHNTFRYNISMLDQGGCDQSGAQFGCPYLWQCVCYGSRSSLHQR